jgi:hypothetical protein
MDCYQPTLKTAEKKIIRERYLKFPALLLQNLG